ncbi:hypothetical protein LAZ67_X004483 [Cordylochernes scorpioides]|uniref:Uncharacterized protein n=1 Tax=Cordylochernes scorpioides TaxID=51811 RepID=A0ABY6LVF5_9ARAC|nr:hypothetical protein LAZ67_X004483 [Cordylochernes scorpioides]
MAILASAKSRIYRYFVQVGLGEAIEDPINAWRRTLSRFVVLTRKREAGDLRELRPSSINDHDFIQLIEYFSRDRENM